MLRTVSKKICSLAAVAALCIANIAMPPSVAFAEEGGVPTSSVGGVFVESPKTVNSTDGESLTVTEYNLPSERLTAIESKLKESDAGITIEPMVSFQVNYDKGNITEARTGNAGLKYENTAITANSASDVHIFSFIEGDTSLVPITGRFADGYVTFESGKSLENPKFTECIAIVKTSKKDDSGFGVTCSAKDVEISGFDDADGTAIRAAKNLYGDDGTKTIIGFSADFSKTTADGDITFNYEDDSLANNIPSKTDVWTVSGSSAEKTDLAIIKESDRNAISFSTKKPAKDLVYYVIIEHAADLSGTTTTLTFEDTTDGLTVSVTGEIPSTYDLLAVEAVGGDSAKKTYLDKITVPTGKKLGKSVVITGVKIGAEGSSTTWDQTGDSSTTTTLTAEFSMDSDSKLFRVGTKSTPATAEEITGMSIDMSVLNLATCAFAVVTFVEDSVTPEPVTTTIDDFDYKIVKQNGTTIDWATAPTHTAGELTTEFIVDNVDTQANLTIGLIAYKGEDASLAVADTLPSNEVSHLIAGDGKGISNVSLVVIPSSEGFVSSNTVKSLSINAPVMKQDMSTNDIPAANTLLKNLSNTAVEEVVLGGKFATSDATVLKEAFSGKRNLKRVDVSAMPITAIADSAFSGVGSKDSPVTISVPTGVTEIGEDAFKDVTFTSGSFTFPSNLATIGDGAFSGANIGSLESLPASVTSIGDYAFAHNNLAVLNIKDGVKYIGEYAFYGNKLMSVSLGNSLETIGAYAFSGKGNLIGGMLTIPATVTKIGDGAFAVSEEQDVQKVKYDEIITAISGGNGLTTVGQGVFAIDAPMASEGGIFESYKIGGKEYLYAYTENEVSALDDYDWTSDRRTITMPTSSGTESHERTGYTIDDDEPAGETSEAAGIIPRDIVNGESMTDINNWLSDVEEQAVAGTDGTPALADDEIVKVEFVAEEKTAAEISQKFEDFKPLSSLVNSPKAKKKFVEVEILKNVISVNGNYVDPAKNKKITNTGNYKIPVAIGIDKASNQGLKSGKFEVYTYHDGATKKVTDVRYDKANDRVIAFVNEFSPFMLVYELDTTAMFGVDAREHVNISASSASGNYEEGDTITLRATVDPGYTWVKWEQRNTTTGDLDATYTARDTSFKMPGHAITLIPVITENTYTIRYDANGGTGTMADQVLNFSDEVSLSGIAYTKSGFIFKGWSNTPGGIVAYVNGARISKLSTVNGTVVNLYAVWESPANRFTLGSATGVSTSGSTISGDINPGETVTLRASVYEGYTWSKWESSDHRLIGDFEDENTSFQMPDGVLKMTPVVTENTYTIKLDPNGGTGEMKTLYGIPYTTRLELPLNKYTKKGYDFDGWAYSSTDSRAIADGGVVRKLTAEDGDVVILYAVWKKASEEEDPDDPSTDTTDVAFAVTTPSGDYINGVNITIKNGKKKIMTVKTKKDDEVVAALETGKEYTAVLSSVPNGYAKASKQVFTAVKGEEVIFKLGYAMHDVKIRLQDNEGNRVKNAAIRVTGTDLDGNATSTISFITKEDSDEWIELPPGKFTIKVATMPDGYDRAEDLSFSIALTQKDDMDFMLSCKKSTNNQTAQTTNATTPNTAQPAAQAGATTAAAATDGNAAANPLGAVKTEDRTEASMALSFLLMMLSAAAALGVYVRRRRDTV